MTIFKPLRALTVILFVLALASVGALKADVPLSVKARNAHVIDVYERLARNSGQQDIPPLTILESPIINAWTDGHDIVLTTGIMKIFENDDQLSMVLAHEMAHYMNHDIMHDDLDSATVEAHADKMGAFIMMRAGFDICKGKEIFMVFKRLFGDSTVPSDHPNNAYRYDQVNMPQCQGLSLTKGF